MNIRSWSLAAACGVVSWGSFASASVAVGDDFNDGLADPTRWAADAVLNSGALTETAGRLEFTASSATGVGEEGQTIYLNSAASRAWQVRLPSDRGWTIEVDAYVTPAQPESSPYSVVAAGLFVVPEIDGYASPDTLPIGVALGVMVERQTAEQSRFLSAYDEQDPFAVAFWSDTPLTAARLSVAFDPLTRTFTSAYAPIGGDRTTLRVTRATEPTVGFVDFVVGVGGVSQAGLVAPGEAYLDNFTVTVVPEPASLAPVALGGLALRRRRGA